MSVEEKVREEEEEQDSDEFMNKAAAGCSGISPMNPERAISNSFILDLFSQNNNKTHYVSSCMLTVHIEQS